DNVTPTSRAQDLHQLTRISSRTTTTEDNAEQVSEGVFEWPLTFSWSETPREAGTTARQVVSQQEYHASETASGDDFSREISSVMTTRDTALIRGGGIVGHEDQASSHEYFSQDSSGACYDRRITAEGSILTGIFDGERCVAP